MPDPAAAIAYQGEPGAFGEEAALRIAGVDATLLPTDSFTDVFTVVAAGDARSGVVPIENSLGGSVLETYDALLAHEGVLHIVDELHLQVHHCLLGIPGTQLADVTAARSHPQALAQSREFLTRHAIEPVASYNTAGAAREVAEAGVPTVAAIASRRAGELYGLEMLAADVQAREDNTTRFVVIAPHDVPPAGTPTRASAAFTTRNEPGALLRALASFASLGLNLTKLESRPTRDTPWEYWFWVDLERADGSSELDRALLEELARRLDGAATNVRLLGAYPRAAAPAAD